MGVVLIYLAAGYAALFLLSQIAQHSEVLSGWMAERLWTAIEASLGGRKLTRPRLGAPLRWAGRKVWGWIATGAMIVVDPFLEIAKSFLPEREQEDEERAPEDTAAARPEVEKEGVVADEPPQVVPASPVPQKAKPTDQEYRAAIAKFGLSPNCPVSAARKAWGSMAASANAERLPEIHSAWLVVCEYRNIRND